MAGDNQQHEEKRVGHVAHDYGANLLELAPELVLESQLVECSQLVGKLNHRRVDDFQEHILAQVVDDHSEPEDKHNDSHGFQVVIHSTLADTHVEDDLLENELELAHGSLLHEHVTLQEVLVALSHVDVVIVCHLLVIFKFLACLNVHNFFDVEIGVNVAV